MDDLSPFQFFVVLCTSFTKPDLVSFMLLNSDLFWFIIIQVCTLGGHTIDANIFGFVLVLHSVNLFDLNTIVNGIGAPVCSYFQKFLYIQQYRGFFRFYSCVLAIFNCSVDKDFKAAFFRRSEFSFCCLRVNTLGVQSLPVHWEFYDSSFRWIGVVRVEF